MNTRIKTWGCVGLGLFVAAGVVLVRSLAAEPATTVSFVGWKYGWAILTLTNREYSPMLCACQTAVLFPDVPVRSPQHSFVLLARSDTQLLAVPHPSPTTEWPVLGATVSLQCIPQPSKLRRRIEVLLSRVGISIAITGFVASVDLPAKMPPNQCTP